MQEVLKLFNILFIAIFSVSFISRLLLAVLGVSRFYSPRWFEETAV